jgi:magnesium transporter
MIITQNGVSWQNLANPDFADLNMLEEKIGVSSAVLENLLKTNKRPKVEEYGNYLLLVTHFPVFDENNRQTVPTELDFVITNNAVFTIYQKPNPVLEKIFAELRQDERRQKEYFKSSGWLLFCLLDRLIDSCLPMLDHIHEKIAAIEREVFEGHERAMLKEIAIVKRDIIDFRQTIKPQRSVLELLAKKTDRFFKNESPDILAQEVIGSEVRAWNTLESHKEMIEAIEKTNEGLLSYQINRVMHTLTFFSIVLFSLTFIASFFSMAILENIQISFGIGSVISLMLMTVILILLIFKKKKWL